MQAHTSNTDLRNLGGAEGVGVGGVGLFQGVLNGKVGGMCSGAVVALQVQAELSVPHVMSTA